MPSISREADSNGLGGKAEAAQDSSGNDAIALPKKTNTPDSNLIIFANNTVLLESPTFQLSKLDPKLIFQEEQAEYLWTCFSIRLKPSTIDNVKVSITATGLGQAAFAYEDLKSIIANKPAVEDTSEQQCKVFRGSSKGWTQKFSPWSQFLEELQLNHHKEGKRIAVRIPADLVPQAGGSIEGKIIVLEPQQKPLEVPLKIQRASQPILLKGFQWFFSVAIPVGLGFLATKVNSEIVSRGQYEEKFNTFKRQQKEMLDKFFSGFYVELDKKYQQDNDNFVSLLELELENKDILKYIPPHKSKKLYKVLNQNQREKINQELIKLFPMQKKIMMNSSND